MIAGTIMHRMIMEVSRLAAGVWSFTSERKGSISASLGNDLVRKRECSYLLQFLSNSLDGKNLTI